MTEPQPYGWFHLLSLGVTVAVTVFLCATHKKGDNKRVHRTVIVTAIVVTLLEIYKQINFNFSYENGVSFDYTWYSFPFQFCSTPMYIGLLAGLTRKGKIHDASSAYLATFSIFAGICVMLYPVTVFIDTIGINIQTMVCHGSMISVGIYLLYSGYVKLEHRTILKAIPIFAVCVGLAVVLNEAAYQMGILEEHNFNMFFISPYSAPELPLFSLIQPHVPFVVSLIIYIGAFTLAAYLILLAAMGVSRLGSKHPAKV